MLKIAGIDFPKIQALRSINYEKFVVEVVKKAYDVNNVFNFTRAYRKSEPPSFKISCNLFLLSIASIFSL